MEYQGQLINPEAPISPGETEQTGEEKERELALFRAEIESLQQANVDRVKSDPGKDKKINLHLAAIRADELIPEDIEWYRRLRELDFSNEEGIKDYKHIAEQFFAMKEIKSKEIEEKFLRNHGALRLSAPGTPLTRDNYAELSAMRDKDSRINYYAWLANEFTIARLKERKLFNDQKVVHSPNQDS